VSDVHGVKRVIKDRRGGRVQDHVDRGDSLPAGEGYEVHGQRRNPQLTEMFTNLKGGNYHEYYSDHYSHRSVVNSVRRGRRLLFEKTTVGVVSHILNFILAAATMPALGGGLPYGASLRILEIHLVT